MSNNIYDILKKFNNLDSVKMLTEGKKACKDCGQVKCECLEESKGSKPDFLDMDKDGDTEEPMKKAAKEKSKGAIAEAVARVEQQLAEKYMGFKKTVAAIKKGGSAEDPEAVAAAIGRKKYGKAKFQKAAAAGKKLGEDQDMAEARDSDTNFGSTVTRGSWVVYDGSNVKRFKSREGAKAYAEKNGGKVASSEFYADNIQKQDVAEGEVDEAVRGAVNSMTGIRPPESQKERDQVAQQLKTNRGANRANPAKTGYGNRVAAQRGAASSSVGSARSVHATDAQGYSDYHGTGVDPKHAGYAGKLRIPAGAGKGVSEAEMTPKQQKFAKLAPPPDKITYADKIAGAKKANEAVYVKPEARARFEREKEEKARAPVVPIPTGPGVDLTKRPANEGFPTVSDAQRRHKEQAGSTSQGKKTATKTGMKHERDWDKEEPTGERGRPVKDKFAKK